MSCALRGASQHQSEALFSSVRISSGTEATFAASLFHRESALDSFRPAPQGIKAALTSYSNRRSLLTMSDQRAGREMEFWIVSVLVSLVSTLLMGLLVSCLDTEKL